MDPSACSTFTSVDNQMFLRTSFLLIVIAALHGCYHGTIDTGVEPSTVVVEKRWAASWLAGLVPPSTVATAGKCPAGVAKVETRLSFLNQLVTFATLNIYSPMEIKVTCAMEGAATLESTPAPER